MVLTFSILSQCFVVILFNKSLLHKSVQTLLFIHSTEWHYLSKVVSLRPHVTQPRLELRSIWSSVHSSHHTSQILELSENNILRDSNTIVKNKILQKLVLKRIYKILFYYSHLYYRKAACAPELCPIITVLLSQLSCCSMNGIHIASHAITVKIMNKVKCCHH